jgi:D-xylose 1-dehydrogenase (NADP+, D-xylono-1,5-lactone-forming)
MAAARFQGDFFMSKGQPLRIGILGAANIARAFTAGCAASPDLEVAAVASRDLAKSKSFAAEVGIARALGSYEALLEDEDIEAVYIPLPNSMHAQWAIRAAETGKHVLCEKPLALDANEARAMFKAAEKHNVILREAYPYLAQPQTAQLRAWLAEQAIGRLRLIRSTFGVLFVDPANIRLNPTLGGGALYDTGSYAVSLIRIVAGTRPARVQAVAQYDANGVDLTTLANLEFADGLLAQCTCSFATAYHRHASIAGDKGVIETNYLNHPPAAGPPVLQIRRGVPATIPFETMQVPDGNGFRLETESFARLVRGETDAWSGATAQESIDIALTLDAIRDSARSGGWVQVAD